MAQVKSMFLFAIANTCIYSIALSSNTLNRMYVNAFITQE